MIALFSALRLKYSSGTEGEILISVSESSIETSSSREMFIAAASLSKVQIEGIKSRED